MMQKLVSGFLILGMIIMTTSCKKTETKEDLLKKISPLHGDVEKIITGQEIEQIMKFAQEYQVDPVTKDEAAIIETTLGTIKFEFFPDEAPNHCNNFKKLANSGFYNGTTFHRVFPDFMIQGGDILSRDNNRLNDGSGGPGYTVNAEFSRILHEPGIVSMARAMDPNSAGSQFFICVAALAHLNGQYSIFGRVYEGMDVVNKIVQVERDPATDNPFQRVIMKRVYVIPRELDLQKE